MRVLILNLPHKDKIVRRYMCSYNSPSFLFPPQELLYCASAIKAWNNAEVFAVDAIAEGKNLDSIPGVIDNVKADMVVTMTGIECFGDDIDAIIKIKKQYPGMKMVVFGYYPSIFAEEVLENTNIDYIIKGEPELCLSQLIKAIDGGKGVHVIPGLIYKGGGDSGVSERIKDLDMLPFPDPSMLSTNDYSEMLMGGPIALIQSSRGCPFNCNYCITTYGRKLVMRSPENVVSEIEFLMKKSFRHFRFTDDTFNVNKARVQGICDLIIKKKLKIRWTALSRVDTLDRDLLPLMKRSGCERVYIGIESFSQKVLDYYQKGYRVEDILERIGWIRRAGIQSTGFMLIGAPIETADDLAENREGLRKARLDFVIVTKLTPYPGTPLFDRLKDDIDFKLFPYHNFFKDRSKEEKMIAVEKELYRVFYWRLSTWISLFKVMIGNPRDFIRAGALFLKFLFTKDQNKQHPDFL